MWAFNYSIQCSEQVQKHLNHDAWKAVVQAVLWQSWNPCPQPCSKSNWEKLWTALVIPLAHSTWAALTTASLIPNRMEFSNSTVIWESTWFMEGGTGKPSVVMDPCFRAPHLELWFRDKLMGASCGTPNSRFALVRRGWEGCSPVQCATPGDAFNPVAAQHFHPHPAASRSCVSPILK